MGIDNSVIFENERYDSLDGIRTIAIIGIIMMHMATNNTYNIPGYFYNSVILSFSDFVFLFMEISAFGMCCGYYEKIINNRMSLSDFYKKRYYKLFPYFFLMVMIDIIVEPSVGSFAEGFMDVLLIFGFLPDPGAIHVIGVGWFLGILFAFYIVFPFFITLLETKRKAWFVFVCSIIVYYICRDYFDTGRTNILYCSCFFFAGGMVYLYRDTIVRLNKLPILVIMVVSIALYYTGKENPLIVFTSILTSAVAFRDSRLLTNKVTRNISKLSLELYLSHMLVFRVIEKLHLNIFLGNGVIQYIFTVCSVIAGTLIFALVADRLINEVKNRINCINQRGL